MPHAALAADAAELSVIFPIAASTSVPIKETHISTHRRRSWRNSLISQGNLRVREPLISSDPPIIIGDARSGDRRT